MKLALNLVAEASIIPSDDHSINFLSTLTSFNGCARQFIFHLGTYLIHQVGVQTVTTIKLDSPSTRPVATLPILPDHTNLNIIPYQILFPYQIHFGATQHPWIYSIPRLSDLSSECEISELQNGSHKHI